MASDTLPPRKGREKVQLKAGFHLMDWVRLSGSITSGSGTRKISRDELALHNKKYDCWTCINGKVYNITQYLPYHPGGEAKLMEGAGLDCTLLFNKFHRWVNADQMLAKCLVGVLEEKPLDDEDVLSADNFSEINDASISAELDLAQSLAKVLLEQEDSTVTEDS